MSDETQAPERVMAIPYSSHNTAGQWVNGGTMGTPYVRHDRTALLASPIVQEIVREERERCVRIAHDHKGLGPASGWSPEEREGYENGQADMQAVIAAAIRKGEE